MSVHGRRSSGKRFPGGPPRRMAGATIMLKPRSERRAHRLRLAAPPRAHPRDSHTGERM
jgi:hypothetical protein